VIEAKHHRSYHRPDGVWTFEWRENFSLVFQNFSFFSGEKQEQRCA
jgi:hypothetical protein